MKKCFCVVLTLLVLLSGFTGRETTAANSEVSGVNALDGVSGKIFNVNLNAKSFDLLKETVFDPKTNEGKSRHTIYWTDKTTFTKIVTQKDFSSITGPVVTVFEEFRGKDAKAAAEGKAFSAKIALVLPQAKEATGFSEDGKKLSVWFTPDKKKNTRTGTAELNGKAVRATLLSWPKAKAIIKTSIYADEISKGFWNTTIQGKEVGGKFVLDSLEVTQLVDPRTVDDPGLPRVLVIGDSISMNYHNAAKAALKGKANYYRCEGNGGPSDRGVASAELWLGDYTKKGLHWDVIQFNHGLHDLKQPYDKANGSWGAHQVSIEDYKKNLEKEIQILKKTGAKLIWCTTSPVPKSSTGIYARRNGEAAVFNKAAMEIISNYPEIQITDLHKFISESKEFDKWRTGTDVHFWSKDLQDIVGKFVAKEITKAIDSKYSVANAGGLEDLFDTPPDWARPSGYWWWLNANVDKEAITRDLENFRANGMGAVLLVSSGNWGGSMPVRGPAFLSDQWLELYKHALKEAHRVGIKVDVNIAPGWNMGGPWITPEKACRWFLQSQTTVKGPQKFSGKLPLPGSKDGYDSKPQLGVRLSMKMPFEEVDYRDNAVVAFRTPINADGKVGPNKREDLAAKSNRIDANCFIRADKVMSQTLGQWASSKDDQPINPKDVIDLTDKFKPDGTLEWDVPAGDWTIVRTGHRMTGAKLSVPMPGQGGLENDYLDRAGVELMFEKAGKVLIEAAGPFAGNTLRGFCSDSFECGYPNWTDNLLKHFKHYRGYDPVPYLPVLKGWIVGSAEISDRFLHDYRKTVADCFADEHYGRFTELCHENGLMTRCEPAGPSWSGTMCMDGLKNLGRVDFPQGEFWRKLFIQDNQNQVGKQTATAAHVYGKRTASAEAFTIGGSHWTGYPELLKPVADRAFCEGINNFVFHTVTSQRTVDGKPGYEYGAGTHFNPNVTWWDTAAGAWVGYINRCQALLQSGLFVADVLYYNGDWAPNLVGPKFVDASLGKGYDYDVCNAEVLMTRLSVKDEKLVLPDGMSYRLLVLPDTDRMPVEIVEKIESLVKAGATVVGPKPQSDPGLKDYPNCDATVRKIAKSLWGNIDGEKIVERKVGSGRVIYGKSLRDILKDDGIVADFEVSGQEDAYIDFIHRATADADFYFLVNRNDRPEKVKVTFRQEGRQPELWDAVTGRKRDLPEFIVKGGRTAVELEFEPHGSMFVVFAKPVAKTMGDNFAKFKVLQQVDGSWMVQFDKEWLYPVDGLKGKQKEGFFVFDKLVDWTTRPEDAVKYYSAAAMYSKEFTFDQDIASGKSYAVGLGEVNIAAKVRLNGTDLGTVWCKPWRIDVSKALKKGVNKLEIEVANLWPNRLIGDGKLPEDQRRTKTNISHYYRKPRGGGEHELFPSGLVGPVRIMKRN